MGLILRHHLEKIEQMNLNKVKNFIKTCRNRYLLYFAYTIVKKTDVKYKEDPKYYINTDYEVVGSDSYDELKEQQELLLSLVSEDNSYILIIVDKLETKILKKYSRFVKREKIIESNNIKPGIETSHFLYSINPLTKNKKVYPDLGYNPDNKLAELDFFFRGPSEIPEDYKWDTGEYEGWLQFRWGDGKNAIE